MTQAQVHGLLDQHERAGPAHRTCVRIERVEGRLRLATGIAAGIVAVVLSGCATSGVAGTDVVHTAVARPGPKVTPGQVAGVVVDLEGKPVENAIVILMSMALEHQREQLTNERGIYGFSEVPPGNYTLQVLAGQANVSKIYQLSDTLGWRSDFRLDPDQEQRTIGMVVYERKPWPDASSGFKASELIWIDD